MADVVGSAEFQLRATRDQMKRDLADAKRDLSGFTSDAEREVGGSTGRIGGMIGKLGLAVGAVTAVIGAGIAIAVKFGSATLQMAQTIEDSARRIGIGTEALQEYQYVARKTGQDANAVGGDLENFSSKLAKAQAGLSKSDADTFSALFGKGFDLKTLNDTEKALELVIDRIGELKNPADRVAIAEKMGLSSLATALREGSDEVARLRDEARDLGFVMDESLIKKGAEAADKMDDLSQIIGIQMAEAFIGLSDEVLAFTGHIAGALNKLNEFATYFDKLKTRMNAAYGDNTFSNIMKGNVATAASDAVDAVRSGRTRNAMDTVRQGGDLFAGMPSIGALQALAAPPPSPRERSELSGRTDLTPVTPRGRSDTSGQRAAEQEARRAARVEEEIARARTRVLGIVDDELQTVQERFDTAKAQVEAERAAEAKQLEGRRARGEVTAAELEQLTLINTQTAALEDRVAADILSRDLADERLAKERALIDLTADLITLQASTARTAGERARLEAQLLAMAQRRARADLETQLARTPGLSEQDKTARRNGLADYQMAERRVAGERNLTPMQEWHSRSLKDAEELSEAYESVAAKGLDALNDGLVDAIMNSRSLGEVFSSVAKQILADLLSISVRKGITEPLANALFGGEGKGGSGGGGFLNVIGSMLKSKIPGFASGTDNAPGGLAYVHGGEVLMNLERGTKVFPAAAVRAMASGGQQAASVVQLVVSEGGTFEASVRQITGPMVEIGKAQAVRSSVDIARRSAPSRQAAARRLGT